ncbi:MAG TPA: group II intron reverse transcriptase/maturase, partial [Syntrophales bacterium]|nr:group II intron reverse transcriptase/maturase [Syntrophales bacterium]
MMTGCNDAVGASSNRTAQWHNINWAECHQTVRRLQARIVKATQEGRHNKVKALQWLLTHSFSAKAIAVKRVTENQGRKTPGVDKKTWSTPEAKSQAVLSLKRRGYKPLPLKRVYIPKSNGEKRPLGIPTMKDRAMQALYLIALEPIAETTADNNSYGFRSERCTADAIAKCFNILAMKHRAEWILEGDIKGCFDNINHDWLIANVSIDKGILRKWLKAGFIDKQTLYPTTEGTPQGGIISPMLANMTLDGLERILLKKYLRSNWNKQKVNLIRYADDFIITGATKDLLKDEVKPLIEEFLKIRGLELSQEKTKITHIEKGFDFLGQNIRKYDGKLLIKPSKKNVQTFLDNVREKVKGNKTAKQANLIKLLNPIIQGWANYHRHVVAKRTFMSVDAKIWKLLWQWAKRRHPMKGSYWIKEKYFKKVGNRNWVFATDLSEGNPEKVLKLVYASDTPIRRHIKIKAEANPLDPKWEIYFEERLGLKMKNNLRERRKPLRLWKNQNGICPTCYQPISKETGWNIHHIQPRCDGGKDNIANLMMLHPNCHRQIHSQRFEVVEPAPERGL